MQKYTCMCTFPIALRNRKRNRGLDRQPRLRLPFEVACGTFARRNFAARTSRRRIKVRERTLETDDPD